MNGPLFTVLIATWNYGHLIGRAIDSVLAQSFQDFELIIVDDGSTDDTRARVLAYGPRLEYLFKENGGQSTACNLGARHARGRFVLVLDADDCLTPHALEAFARAIAESGPEAEQYIYYGGYVSVAEDGREKTREAVCPPASAEERLRRYLERRLVGLQHGSTIVPRKVFERIRYPEGLRNQIDNVFFGQVIANLPAQCVRATISRIHAHPQRERRQTDRVLQASLAPVDALFDPSIIPARLMQLREYYLGRRLRSLARLLYLEGRYREARDYYLSAWRASPACMLEFASIKRALISTLLGLRR